MFPTSWFFITSRFTSIHEAAYVHHQIWERGGAVPFNFNSCEREQSSSRPDQRVPSTHQMGNWVNTTVSVDGAKKRKILASTRNLNQIPLSCSL